MLKVQEIEPGNLHPWEGNPKVNEHAVDAVAESIHSFGFKVFFLNNFGNMLILLSLKIRPGRGRRWGKC
jgi:hypothetical protein